MDHRYLSYWNSLRFGSLYFALKLIHSTKAIVIVFFVLFFFAVRSIDFLNLTVNYPWRPHTYYCSIIRKQNKEYYLALVLQPVLTIRTLVA